MQVMQLMMMMLTDALKLITTDTDTDICRWSAKNCHKDTQVDCTVLSRNRSTKHTEMADLLMLLMVFCVLILALKQFYTHSLTFWSVNSDDLLHDYFLLWSSVIIFLLLLLFNLLFNCTYLLFFYWLTHTSTNINDWSAKCFTFEFSIV